MLLLFCIYVLMQDFIIPAAIPIMATGSIKTAPPTKKRHTISIGRANTMRRLAMIFAMPQVNLNARLMDLISSQTKMITANNSSISFPFHCLDIESASCLWLYYTFVLSGNKWLCQQNKRVYFSARGEITTGQICYAYLYRMVDHTNK